MNKLAIDFAGLHLPNPFLLASGPCTRNYSAIKYALNAGWAGVITKSISLAPPLSPTPRLLMFYETDSLFNIELISGYGYQKWSRWIKALKKIFPKQVIIASIMGSTKMTDWEKLAKIMENSGADALELNVSCPHGMPEQVMPTADPCPPAGAAPWRTMGSLIGQDKNLVAEVTYTVKKNVRIPVIVKLTPNVTELSEIARACAEAGADALSGINTIKAFAGIDIHNIVPKLSVRGYSTYGGYGGRAIKPIALRCVAEMVQATELPVSAIGGIATWQDAVEFLLLGASSVQVCTAAICYGINIIEQFKSGLTNYLKQHKFYSARTIIGKAKNKIAKFADLTLKPFQYPLINKNKCLVNCQTCLVTCRSAGFKAIQLGKDNKPCVKVSLCEGCGLCLSVCPYNAIIME